MFIFYVKRIFQIFSRMNAEYIFTVPVIEILFYILSTAEGFAHIPSSKFVFYKICYYLPIVLLLSLVLGPSTTE